MFKRRTRKTVKGRRTRSGGLDRRDWQEILGDLFEGLIEAIFFWK